jgi:hypothetical protein
MEAQTGPSGRQASPANPILAGQSDLVLRLLVNPLQQLGHVGPQSAAGLPLGLG